MIIHLFRQVDVSPAAGLNGLLHLELLLLLLLLLLLVIIGIYIRTFQEMWFNKFLAYPNIIIMPHPSLWVKFGVG